MTEATNSEEINEITEEGEQEEEAQEQQPMVPEDYEDQMEKVEENLLEVCDQLDEVAEPAEVQIVVDDVTGESAREVGTFKDINKTLIQEEYIEPDAPVIEINESSQLAQTLLEPNPDVAKEMIKELVPEKSEV